MNAPSNLKLLGCGARRVLLVTELGDGASTAELRTDLSRILAGRTMTEIAELAEIFCRLVERRTVSELLRLADDPPPRSPPHRTKPGSGSRSAAVSREASPASGAVNPPAGATASPQASGPLSGTANLPAGALASLHASLEPVDSTAATFRLQGVTIVGRSRVCELSIASPKISRRHTKLSPTGEGFAIEDLGSANKTWLNGSPVEKRTPLSDGDLISFGEVAYVYRVKGPATRSSAGQTRAEPR